jgi:hypothetical protein
MRTVDRRSAVALGLVAAALAAPSPASAQMYGPSEGEEVEPGVRVVNHGERPSTIPAYKKIQMLDIIIAPGVVQREEMMTDDMICTCPDGELLMSHNGHEFTVGKGDAWTCAKGITLEGFRNTSSAPAVMRVVKMLA